MTRKEEEQRKESGGFLSNKGRRQSVQGATKIPERKEAGGDKIGGWRLGRTFPPLTTTTTTATTTTTSSLRDPSLCFLHRLQTTDVTDYITVAGRDRKRTSR